MEHDRYQQNSKLFIVGMITLLLSLILFSLSFYLLPFLLWEWQYNVPTFVIDWQEWLKQKYEFTGLGASRLIFFVLIIPGLICGYISHLISDYIDTQVCEIQSEKTELSPKAKGDVADSLNVAFKIIVLIILPFIGLSLIQWLLALPPPG